MSIKSLIINPGSTSTKIGVFEDETLLFEETLRHSTEEIGQYATIFDQKDFRKKIITDLLTEKNFDMKSLNMVVGRGGMLKPIPGGTYAVTDELLEDLKIGRQGQHASNLGGILAREIGDELGVPSYIVDPVVVDELQTVARYSGVPELPRTSVFHALNQKAVAKRYAKECGKAYESLRLIVVHMGGGVSVGAHIGGRVGLVADGHGVGVAFDHLGVGDCDDDTDDHEDDGDGDIQGIAAAILRLLVLFALRPGIDITACQILLAALLFSGCTHLFVQSSQLLGFADLQKCY